MKKFVAGALALGAATAAQASDITGFAGFGLTGGGEKLVTVQYSNGTSQDIRSGGFVELRAGIEYRPQAAPFAVQASVGYHVDDTNASNGSVRFSRVPLELIGFWNATPNWRFGGGLRHATGVQLSSSGAASDLGGVDFEANTGTVVVGEYLFSPHWGVDARYVNERYTVKGTDTHVDGSHFGMHVSYYF